MRTISNKGARDPVDDLGMPPESAALPERLVTALLLAALQTPGGQQLWLGYALARDDLPWLQEETFRLVRCAATVEHVPRERGVYGGNDAAAAPGGG